MELTITAVLVAGTLIFLAKLAGRVSALERDVTGLHGTWRGLVLSGRVLPDDAGASVGLDSMDDPFEILKTLPDGVRATPEDWRLFLVVDPECSACGALMRAYATGEVPAEVRQGYHLVIASRDCALPPAWRAHFTQASVLCGDELGVLARLVPPAALILDPSGTPRGVTEVSGFDELVAFLEDGRSRGIGPEAAGPAPSAQDGPAPAGG